MCSLSDRGFYSPTKGRQGLGEMLARIDLYTSENPHAHYEFLVGTDSPGIERGPVIFITALVIHRIDLDGMGRGGIYYWIESREFVASVEERISREARISLDFAKAILEEFPEDLKIGSFAIHVDAGRNGDTRKLLSGLIEAVRKEHFSVEVKPNALAASCVAHNHT